MNQQETKLKLPYASSGQVDLALDIFRRISPKKINSKFVVDNNLTTATNAFKIIDFLKWLGIINNLGDVNEEVARKLKLIGDERDKFIVSLIENSYKDLFENANPTRATKEDITNFIIHNYQFGQAQAKMATALFLHLCQKYKIPMADELKKKVYKKSGEKKEKIKNINQKKKENKSKNKEIEYSGTGATISIRGPGISFDLPINNQEELQEAIDVKLNPIYNAIKALLPKKENEEDDTHL